MKKKMLWALLAAFVIIQFFRPEKNNSDDQLFAVSKKYDVPAEVESILKVACYDCHSNNTNYPWYANIQPAAWWLSNHVKDGKWHLNFSDFVSRSITFQNHKFAQIATEVEEKGMPLPAYTYLGLHSAANLSDAQRKTIIDWAHTQMDSLKNQYPRDSLIWRFNGPPAPVN